MNRTDIVSEVLSQTVKGQPLYRQYANTINATLAAVVGALAALLALWQTNGSNDTIVAILVVAVPILTGVVTRLTRNGVTSSVQARVVSEAVELDHAEAKAIVAATPATPPVYTTALVSEADSLDDPVDTRVVTEEEAPDEPLCCDREG